MRSLYVPGAEQRRNLRTWEWFYLLLSLAALLVAAMLTVNAIFHPAPVTTYRPGTLASGVVFGGPMLFWIVCGFLIRLALIRGRLDRRAATGWSLVTCLVAIPLVPLGMLVARSDGFNELVALFILVPFYAMAAAVAFWTGWLRIGALCRRLDQA